MRLSILRYPKRDRYIQIHASLLVACEDNACAAALLRFFEYWHNWRLKERERLGEFNEMLTEAGANPIIDLSGWQYHTTAQLEAGLLKIYSPETINKALAFLERKGFISTAVPDSLRAIYKTGRTRWFLLMVDVIQSVLDAYEVPEATLPEPPVGVAVPKVKERLGMAEQMALRVFEYRDLRRKAYWKTKGRDVQDSRPDAKRIRLIADAYKHFSFEQLCLAVDGNLSDPWYQGDNDRKMIYDKIETIYRNNEQIEKFINKALAAGHSEETVRQALSGAPDKPDNDAYDRLARLILPYALGESDNLELIIRQTAVAYGRQLDLGPLKDIIVPMIERRAGMYAETHAERLREFGVGLRNYE